MSGPLREALEVTIASDPKLAEDRHAALVSLCRVFADQVDEAGESASSRLTAAYLSALKDLGRAMGEDRKPEGAGGKLALLQGQQQTRRKKVG